MHTFSRAKEYSLTSEHTGHYTSGSDVGGTTIMSFTVRVWTMEA